MIGWREQGERRARSQIAVSEIWNLRNGGQIDEAAEALLDRLIDWNVKPALSVAETYSLLIAHVSDVEAIDLLMLDVSFLRHRLELEQAEKKLAACLQLMSERGLRPHFQVFFQDGLNALIRSRYSAGLDRFMGAMRHARNVREYHIAAMNWILCLENLGYDYDRHVREYEESLRPYRSEPWATPCAKQLDALRIRCAIRGGDLNILSEMLQHLPEGEQARYALAWVSDCPIFGLARSHKNASKELSGILESLKDYVYPYRVRTLKGLLIDEDLRAEIRVADQVERFYLWVWRWLRCPDPATLERIVRVRQKLETFRHQQFTAEEFRMLENASRWLALFLGLTDDQVRRSLATFSWPPGIGSPAFDVESLVLDYFFALRDQAKTMAADTLTVLRSHPLTTAGQAPLIDLVSSVLQAEDKNHESAWGDLPKGLRDICMAEPSAEDFLKKEGILVNMRTARIKVFKAGKEAEDLKSSSLARLLCLFCERDSLSVREVLKECFGFSGYDPFVHDPKVANFMARANRLFRPWCDLVRRSGRIYVEQALDHVAVVSANRHTLLLAGHTEIFDVLAGATGVSRPTEGDASKSKILAPAELPLGWISRSVLEGYLGVSRATALRMMNRWLKDGCLTKKGVGKATMYRVAPSLHEELSARTVEKDLR